MSEAVQSKIEQVDIVNRHSHHWTMGGLSITNFGKDSLDIYCAAIAASGYSDRLVISTWPTNNFTTSHYCLQFKCSGVSNELADFWKKYAAIEKWLGIDDTPF